MSSLFIVPAGEIAQFDAGTIPNPGEMFLRRGMETCAPTNGNWIETLWMARFHNIQPGEKLQERLLGQPRIVRVRDRDGDGPLKIFSQVLLQLPMVRWAAVATSRPMHKTC